ncbi:hypothetical protein GGR50DRAFT_553317 [Xylaria sp. CBS 124048]|nr:hypothetical protein GGR50DRAFT_553317 [Xylaria sp. CBS 124048]
MRTDPQTLLGLAKVNTTFRFMIAQVSAYREITDEAFTGPTTLTLCIQGGLSTSELAAIIEIYTRQGASMLGRATSIHEPPLHAAARYGRVDAACLLIRNHYPMNIKWSGNPAGLDCSVQPHLVCRAGSQNCKNALSVAREVQNQEMVDLLIAFGVEDLGNAGTISTAFTEWADTTGPLYVHVQGFHDIEGSAHAARTTHGNLKWVTVDPSAGEEGAAAMEVDDDDDEDDGDDDEDEDGEDESNADNIE